MLRKDSRLLKILLANTFSSMGSGITMIAVPWLFVTREGGDTLFGLVTIGVTIMLFLITPFIGNLIDQLNRKNLLIIGKLAGFVLVLFFAFVGMFGGEYQVWHLTMLFISASLYYNLFYPTIFAFNQEIFEPSQYKTISGLMEVQGQFAAVLSGGIAALLLPIIDFQWILLLNATTYAVAISLFLYIPYKKRLPAAETKTVSFWRKLSEGFIYMKKNPYLFLFLVASFMPFITIMVTNYVFPVYIETILQADASVYGMQSMVYGIGAVLAGLLLPIILKRTGNEKAIVSIAFIFWFAISLYIFFPVVSIFYVLTVLIAFGNAGVRVARNSLMMERIPNEKIGRVDSLFRAIGLGFRILLLSMFTQMIAQGNVIIPFQVLSIIIFVSFITLFIIYQFVMSKVPSKKAA